MAGEGRGGLVTIAHTSLSPPASSSLARLRQMLDISQTQEVKKISTSIIKQNPSLLLMVSLRAFKTFYQ